MPKDLQGQWQRTDSELITPSKPARMLYNIHKRLCQMLDNRQCRAVRSERRERGLQLFLEVFSRQQYEYL
jgi:hypothetical protein